MSHALERLLVWLVATATGAGLLYVALTASKDVPSIVLGVFIVLGVAIASVGVLGFAIEVVNWVNRVLPDAPNAATYERVVDRPAPVVERQAPMTGRTERPKEPGPTDEPTTRTHPHSDKDRVFVDVTHEYLIGLFKDKLGIQANKLIAPYIGKWMIVSGKLGDVLGSDSLQVSFDPMKVNEYLWMYFDSKWQDRLSVLTPGHEIRVVGRITSVDPISVTLRECELVGTVEDPIA